LRQLEDELARQPFAGGAVETEIERAVLLGALNRRADAQQAFVELLRRAPTHFSALNEFGTLLTDMGAIDAACRVYAEAIAHHPANPIGHVNLANLLLRANKYTEARAHYDAALRIDPELAPAHQGLGAVLADNGDRDGAQEHFRKAGVAKRIKVQVGIAQELINKTPGKFDLIFIDVDKQQYPDALRSAMPKLKRGGLLVTDNTLWSGKAARPLAADDKDTRGVQEFNRLVYASKELFPVLIPLRDGVTVCRKL